MAVTALTYVSGNTLDAVQDGVTTLIGTGYKPFGPVVRFEENYYCQAMVDGTDPGSLEELLLLDNASSANSTASVAAVLDASKRIRTNASVGTVETGVTAVEYGDGLHHCTVLTLTDFAVGTSDDDAALAIGGKLYTFPAGAYAIDGVKVNVGLTLADAVQTDTPELGLGTAQASGANATLGAAGATTENIFEGTATADVAGTALVSAKNPTAGAPLLVQTSGGLAHTLYLNAAVTWADLTAASAVTADGTVTIFWRFFG